MSIHIPDIFTKLSIKNVVCMPDSLNNRMIGILNNCSTITVLQCLNETDVITICSGLNLGGQLSIAAFENSGIRSVADILTRFESSHHIHNIFLLSKRGSLGEQNWWGVNHQLVTNSILCDLNILIEHVDSIYQLESALTNATKTFRTDQKSIALCLSPTFFESVNL